MGLYKLIDENTVKRYDGGFVILDNMIHTNPKEETLRQLGFKDLQRAEDPEYNADEEFIKITYSDEGECIEEIKTVMPIITDEAEEEAEEDE